MFSERLALLLAVFCEIIIVEFINWMHGYLYYTALWI